MEFPLPLLGFTCSLSLACLVTFPLSGCGESTGDGPQSGGASGGWGGEPSSGGTTSSTGGAPSSTGGSPALELILPIERGDDWVLEFGSTWFAVDPDVGGRITAFGTADTNLLTGSDNNGQFWGSTLWTSPQSELGWPPPATLDSAPYEATLQGNRVTLVGGVAEYEGKSIRFTKLFEPDLVDEKVLITYRMTNEGTSEATLAAWEVTRVAHGGLSFFPTGDRAFTPNDVDPVPVQSELGITWYDNAADPNTLDPQKLHADGKEGWLAHVAGRLVFIKRFADLPLSSQADGEGEIEIFTAPDDEGGYVELENQGAYGPLAAGASRDYQVTWLVRELPASVTVAVGSQSLLDFVRSQL